MRLRYRLIVLLIVLWVVGAAVAVIYQLMISNAAA